MCVNDKEGKHASGIVHVYLHVQKQGETKGSRVPCTGEMVPSGSLCGRSV